MTREFNLGDRVWQAWAGRREKKVVCPDCLGQRALTIIMGDGSQVSIECVGCAAGYEPPTGRVTEYEFDAAVIERTITKVEITAEGREYRLDECYCGTSQNVAATQEEAEHLARQYCQEEAEQEQRRISSKEKPTRSWAWNAHYHRKCIRDLKKQLVYHANKLAAAKTHVKDEKDKPVSEEEP